MTTKRVFKSASKFREFLSTLEFLPKAFNRPTTDQHIAVMKESIERIGVLRDIVILVTSAFGVKNAMYVLDGQHLLRAILDGAKITGEFGVTITHLDNIEDIICAVSTMNATAKPWRLNTYLDAWVSSDYDDYKYLRSVYLKTGYGLSGLIEAYTGAKSKGNRAFKTGNFAANRKDGDRILKIYNEACALGLKKRNSSFLAFTRFYIEQPKFSYADFINGISANKEVFSDALNRDSYIGLFKLYCSGPSKRR